MALSLCSRPALGALRRFSQVSARPPGEAGCPPPAPPPPCAEGGPGAPPCRAQPPPAVPPRRVVCRSVLRPRRPSPPCEPRQPLSCAAPNAVQAKSDKACDIGFPQLKNSSDCGVELDYVAQRLEAAREVRRQAYEQEVAERLTRRPAPLATASYKPPTQPLFQDNCQPRRPVTVDPCAHRPKIIVEVDRTSVQDAYEPPSSTPITLGAAPRCPPCPPPIGPVTPPCPPCPPPIGPVTPPSGGVGLTSRIMSSIGLGSAGTKSGGKCSKPSCGGTSPAPGMASHPGDTSWCGSTPPGGPAPPRCREPTLAERLRRRARAPCSRDSPRRLHTCTALFASSHDVTLRERAPATEGRQTACSTAEDTGARLELALGAGRRVQVSVQVVPSVDPNKAVAETASDSNSWRSIRHFQKQLNETRGHNSKICTSSPASHFTCPRKPISTTANKTQFCGSPLDLLSSVA